MRFGGLASSVCDILLPWPARAARGALARSNTFAYGVLGVFYPGALAAALDLSGGGGALVQLLVAVRGTYT